MKKRYIDKKVQFVKRGSSLHKQLETSSFIGYREGIGELLNFLYDHSAFSQEYVTWLIEEDFDRTYVNEELTKKEKEHIEKAIEDKKAGRSVDPKKVKEYLNS